MEGRKLGETAHLALLPTGTRTGAIVLKRKLHPVLDLKAMPSLQITGGEYTLVFAPQKDLPCFMVTCYS